MHRFIKILDVIAEDLLKASATLPTPTIRVVRLFVVEPEEFCRSKNLLPAFKSSLCVLSQRVAIYACAGLSLERVVAGAANFLVFARAAIQALKVDEVGCRYMTPRTAYSLGHQLIPESL